MKVLEYWRSVLVTGRQGASELKWKCPVPNFLSWHYLHSARHLNTFLNVDPSYQNPGYQKGCMLKMLKAPELRNQFIFPFLFQTQGIFRFLKPSPSASCQLWRTFYFRDNVEHSVSPLRLPPASEVLRAVGSGDWRAASTWALSACGLFPSL